MPWIIDLNSEAPQIPEYHQDTSIISCYCPESGSPVTRQGIRGQDPSELQTATFIPVLDANHHKNSMHDCCSFSLWAVSTHHDLLPACWAVVAAHTDQEPALFTSAISFVPCSCAHILIQYPPLPHLTFRNSPPCSDMFGHLFNFMSPLFKTHSHRILFFGFVLFLFFF